MGLVGRRRRSRAGPAAAGRSKKAMRFTACPIRPATARTPDYIVVRESELALKPNSLHHIRAAAVPLAALTAWQSLFDAGAITARPARVDSWRQRRCWTFAVQLAKWKGAHVLATASTKNQELLRELGVDEPIDYTKQKFEDVARDVDLVLDLIGGETQERSWSVLKKGGVLLSLVQPPSDEKAKALGVRAAFVAGHPSGAQLAEIAKIIDRASSRL